MKAQEKFQALIQAATEREQRATQALMNLKQHYDDEGRKAQKQIESLRTEMRKYGEEKCTSSGADATAA